MVGGALTSNLLQSHPLASNLLQSQKHEASLKPIETKNPMEKSLDNSLFFITNDSLKKSRMC